MTSVFIFVYGALFLFMCGMWFSYLYHHNPSVIDVGWSIGLCLAGWIYLVWQSHTLKTCLIGMILFVWSMRLAGYIWYTRIRLQHVDKRYTELSLTWKISKNLGFFLQYQLQGILIFIISSVFYFISLRTISHWTLLDCIAIGVLIISITGESLADWQLQTFKANHPGKVCDVGLWRFSRHPNYFFDWITWCAFCLIAIQATHGYLALISPLLLLYIFTCVTGPITERASLASRGQAFVEYQKRTPMFFPWVK